MSTRDNEPGGYLLVPSVLMTPGATALALMSTKEGLCKLLDGIQLLILVRYGAHSIEIVLVKFFIPALAAPVWTIPGNPFFIWAITFTIAPLF